MKISRFYLFPLFAPFLTPLGLRAQDLLETPLPFPILTSWLTFEDFPQISVPSGARLPGTDFYASAQKPVFPTHAQLMRQAVQTLGVAQHRFVRCELRDGSSVTGAISRIDRKDFTISQGIFNSRPVRYSDLKSSPWPGPAVPEHLVNVLEWTGVVALCVAAIPLLPVFIPLMLTGVIAD
jgi:hypothetical protein